MTLIQLPGRRSLLPVALVTAAYCLWVGLVVGFRADHALLIALCLCCWALNGRTRRFIRGFFVFVVYWVVYDSMRVWPNYLGNPVHIGDLYALEKNLFGFVSGGAVVTPNEYFEHRHAPWLDLLAGFFYINWVPVPLAYAIYLFYRDKLFYIRYAFAFVVANLIGFVLYYLYPAAPPWFVSEYGFEFLPGAPASPARLLRVDELLGMPLFQSVYSKNANIFAAMPSLHSAYPVILLYYGLRRKQGFLPNLFFAAFMLGIWFTAVYSNHHYILDVIAGAACAVGSILVFEWLFARKRVRSWFEGFAKTI
jgi:hypothetical protein